MLKNIFLFFLVTLMLGACKSDNEEKGIIPRDKMTRVLIDIHIVDGGIYTVLSQNPDSLYKYGFGKYMVVFKRYHVDSAQFRRSLKYYTRQPAMFALMYTDIMTTLQAKTDSLNRAMYGKPNRPKNDRRPPQFR